MKARCPVTCGYQRCEPGKSKEFPSFRSRIRLKELFPYLQWTVNGESGPIGVSAPKPAAEATKSAQGVLINNPSMGAPHVLEKLQDRHSAQSKIIADRWNDKSKLP